MALPVMPLSFFALLGTFRYMLFEKNLQDLAPVAHQSTQKALLYRRHIQHACPGILISDRLQECFALAVAFLLRFLAFFLPAG